MKTRINFWSYHSEFFLEWEMLQAEIAEKMKTRFIFSDLCFNLCHLWDDVEKKNCKAGQALHAGYLRLQTQIHTL